MDKFFNLMYDFFAFAFPGTCIIASLLLFKFDSGYLYLDLPIVLKNNFSLLLIISLLGGYLVGYILHPIAHFLLLQIIGLKCLSKLAFLFSKKKSFKKRKQYCKHKHFVKSNNLSEMFVCIREYSPKNAQYIEFWDMHVKMSLNLAFACVVFLPIILLNISKSNIYNNLFTILLVTLITLFVFFSLIFRAVYYSYWWMQDIEETYKLIKKRAVQDYKS